MRWVRRGLWVATWCAWAWCGFGLFRELPRDLAPPITHLSIEDEELPLGFISSSDEFLTFREGDNHTLPWKIVRHNARTGSTLSIIDGPMMDQPWSRATISQSKKLMVVRAKFRPDRTPSSDSGELAVLDLKTGAWTDLPKEARDLAAIHPRRPWLLFEGTGPAEAAAAVYDLDAKKFLARRPPSADVRPYFATPYFVADLFAVPVGRSDESGTSDQVELWSVTEGRRLKTCVGVPGKPPVYSGTHERAVWRVMWPEDARLLKFNWGSRVYDFDRSRLVFDTVPAGQSVMTDSSMDTGGGRGLVLSGDGRSALELNDEARISRLWEIDTGRLLWASGDSEKYSRALNDEEFETEETWSLGMGEWRWARRVNVVRRLTDGNIKFRCWTPLGSLYNNGPVGRLRVDWETHNVYDLSPLINYPLLALCQAILALPLVLLWAALRWRRKRRMRLASAAP